MSVPLKQAALAVHVAQTSGLARNVRIPVRLEFAESPPRKHRCRQNARRWKNAPYTMTAKVSSSSGIPDQPGDSTIPNTWSAQVIARNWRR